MHHTITSYCITSHHTSFASTETVEKEGKLLLQTYWLTHRVKSIFGKELWKDVSTIQDLCLWQWYFYTRFMPSTMVFLCNIYGETFKVASAKKGDFFFFFMKHEKKGRCFFACGSKMIHTKISRVTKKYITSLNIQIADNWFLQKRSCMQKFLSLNRQN